MKQFILLLALLFLTITQGQTTQNIKGIVVDLDSDFPLTGAEISVEKNKKIYGAVSDINGEYVIRNVPIGKINVTVRFTGYENKNYTNLDLESGKELIINIKLKERVDKLNEVVIVSHKKRDQVAFAVSSNYSMTTKQINHYAGSLGDVSRMAMNYAGVSSNDDSRNDIIVRGNNPSSLLWTMEGVSIPNPNHYSTSGSSGGPVSMINVNLLGKSEFLAGAFPANFGNTTSAAFDLKFRKGNRDKYEFLGQIGFAGAELGAEGPISKKNKSSFLINYRYSTLELFDKFGINMGLGTAVPKYQDASFILNFPTKKMGTIRVWSIAGKSKIRFLTTKEGGDNLYLDYQSSDLKTSNYTIISGINNKYFFNKKTSLFTSVSYSKLDQRVRMDTLNTATNNFDNLYSDKIITGYTTAKAEIKSKRNSKNTFAIGSEYTAYNINLFMEVHKPTYSYSNSVENSVGLLSSYINWKHNFNDNLTINSGVRAQLFELNNQISIEPRLGILYKVKDNTKLSFAYGLHSNIHSLLAYFSKHKIDGKIIYKNKELGFAKSHHFVLGIQQILAEKVNLKTEIYYQYLFDIPVYHSPDSETYSIINSGYTSPGGSQVFFAPLYNDGFGKNYGIDITLERPLEKGFYMLVTGSLYDSKYQAADKKWRNSAWNGNFMSSVLTGKEFIFSNKSLMHIDINLNYSGGRRYTPIDEQASIIAGEAVYGTNQIFEKKLPNYFRTDLKISYKKSGDKITQEWQLDLRNIFNRHNIFSQRYNKVKNKIEYTYQSGFLPVMQYKIMF